MSFANTAKSSVQTFFKPHQYQKDAIDWVVSRDAAGLFLPPGMGKTAILLKAFLAKRKEGKIKKMLVIAPIRVCHLVWPAEIEKWGDFKHLDVSVVHGHKKGQALAKDADIYCINPDGLQWLFTVGRFEPTEEWMLVVDESSQFKNSTSQRFKYLKKRADKFGAVVIMTGTPAPNGLDNIWSQIFLLDQGERLGQFVTQYRNRYFFPSGYMGYGRTLAPGSEELIYEKIDDLVLHKSREELDMPGISQNTIEVSLPADARQAYNDMRQHLVAQLDEDTQSIAVNGAVMAGKLKQIANGAVYKEDRSTHELHTEKISAIKELVEDLEGRPLLVFYEYNHDLSRLLKAFPGAPTMGGQTSASDAVKNLAAWNAGKVPIMFLHPASAGHGLNMQSGGCTDVCFFSITWDQELHEQAIGRVWRQGVKSAVTVHYIVARNTIDGRIMRVLHDKEVLQSALLDALKK